LSYTRLFSKNCPFDPSLAGFAQSPEPHPYTQPKRTAKVGEKPLKPKVESKKLKEFGLPSAKCNSGSKNWLFSSKNRQFSFPNRLLELKSRK
jgi:hypothetical protein